MNLAKNIHWFLYALFILSCARQTTPTGGPKDSIPPTLVNSIPRHGEINFNSKTIELTFNETIILNNPREQLIITPDIGKDIDAKAKKNQVILTLDQDLQQNTTYSINFREAVQDITEKNPAQMLKLAFSTGDYIDSLSIAGDVYDPLKNKEIKDATVGLYQSDTFNIFQHRPTYFTKTNEKGNFLIENLKPGRYFIYAFEDKNKNLIIDSKTEAYGFKSDSINLSQNINGIKIPLIHMDSRPLKLTSARPSGTYFNFKATKNLISFKISTPEDETLISSFGEDQTNVRLYNTFPDKDSLLITFTATDSIHNLIDTTLYTKFTKREIKPENFELSLNNFKVIGTKGILQGRIKFTKPLLSINFDSLYYSIDSVQTIPLSNENLRWDSLRNQLYLEKSFDKNLLPKETTSNQRKAAFKLSSSDTPKKPSLQNVLYIGKSAFISIERDSSQQITEKLIPSQLEDTGVIIVQIETQNPHFIVQLLTKSFEEITSKRNTKKLSFEDLKPGDYQLRLIIDENNNGKWDPGNFFLNQEPERILFYKNEKLDPNINLKANWELGPLLITD
jgi:uncharacterized protein (DUF2141 family)